MKIKKIIFMIVLVFLSVILCDNVNAAPLPHIDDKTITINESGYYTLDGNLEANVVVGVGVNVTIDLNGFTLTNIDNHTISNYGTLTIKNGTVDNITGWKAAIANYPSGEVTIESGTYTRSKETGSGSNTYYVINNLGKMTINNANIYVGESYSYSALIHNGYYGDKAVNDLYTTPNGNSVEIAINGGNYNGGNYILKNDNYGKTIITGGTYYNNHSFVLLNYNIMTINGGNFTYEGTDSLISNQFDNDNDGKGILNINGGYFKGIAIPYTDGSLVGGIVVTNQRNTTLNITNGYFMTTMPVSNDLVAARTRLIWVDSNATGSVNISGGYFNRDVYANGSDGAGYNNGRDYVEDGYYAVPIGKVTSGEFPRPYTTYDSGDEWYWVTDRIELIFKTIDKEKYIDEKDPILPEIEVYGFQPVNKDGIIINNNDTLENTFSNVFVVGRELGEDVNEAGYKYYFNNYSIKDYGEGMASSKPNEKSKYYYKNVYVVNEMAGVLKIHPLYKVEVKHDKNSDVSVSVEKGHAGERVKVNVYLKDGYKLKSLVVKDANGNIIELDADNMFIMPYSDVEVIVESVPISQNEHSSSEENGNFVKVGNTGKNKNMFLTLVSSIFIILGSLLILNDKREN